MAMTMAQPGDYVPTSPNYMGPLEYHVGYRFDQVLRQLDGDERLYFEDAVSPRYPDSHDTFICRFDYSDLIWHPGAGYVFLHVGEWVEDLNPFQDFIDLLNEAHAKVMAL